MKNHITTIIVYLIIAGSFFTCSKSPKCWGDNKNKGIINENLPIGFPYKKENNYIVNSDSAYTELFTDSNGELVVNDLPPIDFSKTTLLGLKVIGQCNVKLISEVTQNEGNKTYLYKTIVKSCGTCKKALSKVNWVSVPKLPNGWDVTFELVEK